MKKLRSLNVKKKLLLIGAVFSVGLFGAKLLDSKIEDVYVERKLGLEKSLGNLINKKIVLGNYEGLRFFGLRISNSKIFEKNNISSKIDAQSVYVGIMPIRSFLNQKWIINVKPQKTSININQSFFNTENLPIIENKFIKNKVNYDLNIHLTRFSKFKLNDLNIETKVRGKFKYSSKPSQIIGYINSKFRGSENLIFKFNSKLDQEDLSLQILSRGINLKNLKINDFNNELALKEGRLKSNFKYSRSSSNSYCEGRFSLNNIELQTKNLEENIKSDYINFN